jgi:Bacterial surface proteins containing Ig-like domains
MKKILSDLFRYRGGISIVFYIALFALLWYLIIPHTSFFYRKTLHTALWNRLNRQDITLVVGETFHLKVLRLKVMVYYSSSDIKVADVNIFGKITAYRCGTTIIRVKVDGKIVKCRVRVIDISKKSLTVTKGRSKTLRIKGAVFGVHWSSSDNSVVRVSRFGKVTGVSKGAATVTGKVRGKKISCQVTVK